MVTLFFGLICRTKLYLYCIYLCAEHKVKVAYSKFRWDDKMRLLMTSSLPFSQLFSITRSIERKSDASTPHSLTLSLFHPFTPSLPHSFTLHSSTMLSRCYRERISVERSSPVVLARVSRKMSQGVWGECVVGWGGWEDGVSGGGCVAWEPFATNSCSCWSTRSEALRLLTFEELRIWREKW